MFGSRMEVKALHQAVSPHGSDHRGASRVHIWVWLEDYSTLLAAGIPCREPSRVAVPWGSHSQGKCFEGRDSILS